MADGFYQANRLLGDKRPIIATIGDSTFLHSGISPLINAVHTGARFVLIILDNSTTAMTGFQPTAASDTLADGDSAAAEVSIPGIVRACGVAFVRVTDPYDQERYRQVLREAQESYPGARWGRRRRGRRPPLRPLRSGARDGTSCAGGYHRRV